MNRCTDPFLSDIGRFSRVRVASALLVLLAPQTAPALETEVGDFSVRLDTTLSQGFTWRAADRDERYIGTANGGTAYSVNNDDGDLNFDDWELGQNVSKFTSDFAVDYGPVSGFARFYGFLDWKQERGSTARTPLSKEAKEVVGEELNILDAYGTYSFQVGEGPGQVRFGKQVLNWGESTFIPNGISIINPIDITKLRTPGSEIREALVPVNMLSLSVSPAPSFAVEGFYQFNWKKFEVDPPGTFFSTNDFVGAGGKRAFLGFGDFSDQGTSFGAVTPAINADLGAGGLSAQPLDDSTFLSVKRGADVNPDNDGQFGFALRLFPESLQGTEFGLYFVNYHSRLPVINARTGSDEGVTEAVTALGLVSGAVGPGNTAAAVGAAQAGQIAGAIATDRYAQTAELFIEYPRNIQMYGASFNTQLGTTGWALQGEYSLKNDLPLQISTTELTFAALTPLSTANAAFPNFEDNQVGIFGTDTVILGYIERDVSQIQISATKVFGPTFGANTALFVGEVGVVHVHDMPSKSTLRLNADGAYTSGDPAQAEPGGANAGKAPTPFDEFPDATSWGFRLAGSLTYNNAVGPVNLTPSLQFAYDVDGISPQPAGPFREGRAAVTVGLSASYLESWGAAVGYTNYFGAGQYNLLGDRDFLEVSVKYSF